jgi:hypothetical protein
LWAAGDEPAGAAGAYWQRVSAACQGGTFLHYGLNDTLWELKGATMHVDVDHLTEADRLNGLEWRAVSWLAPTAARDHGGDGPSWSPWTSGSRFYVHIERSGGQTTFNGRSLNDAMPAPSCREVLASLAPAAHLSATQESENWQLSRPFDYDALHAQPGQHWSLAAAPVHTQPDEHSPVAATLADAEIVTFGGWEGRWARVSGSFGEGYVLANFFRRRVEN